MSRWWRAYDEALDDPKLQMLRPEAFRTWFNLCCITSQHGGTLPGIGAIAFRLRLSLDRTKHLIAELAAAGLVDVDEDGRPSLHNWSRRQYKSDVTDATNAERQKRYRKRHAVTAKAVTPTVTETVTETVTVKRPDTEAETETEKSSEANASARQARAGPPIDGEIPDFLRRSSEPAVVDEDAKAKLFRVGKTILVSFGVAERRTGALIGHWLKARPDPAGLLAAIEFARDQNVAEPVAYVSALISKKSNGATNGSDRRPGESLGDLGRRLAEEARRLELAAGVGRADDAVRGH